MKLTLVDKECTCVLCGKEARYSLSFQNGYFSLCLGCVKEFVDIAITALLYNMEE